MIDYDLHKYNCGHHAVKLLNESFKLDIKIDFGNEWQVELFKFIRQNMRKSLTPIENCLVAMSTKTGGLHFGIYRDFAVEHNYNTGHSGCVIISDMGTIRAEFDRVRFYAPR